MSTSLTGDVAKDEPRLDLTITDRCEEVLDFCRRIYEAWPCVLVGGAVRDLLMGREPTDWDVYYLMPDGERALLEKCFASRTSPLERPFKRHANLVAEFSFDDARIQIMFSRRSGLDEILDETDWNVSAFGFDGEIHARESVENLQPGQRLRLLKVTNPISTLSRGFGFASRFQMIFDSHDVVKLCRLVANGTFYRKPRVRRKPYGDGYCRSIGGRR